MITVTAAQPQDFDALAALTLCNSHDEILPWCRPDLPAAHYRYQRAVIDQIFDPGQVFVAVARDHQGVQGWAWFERESAGVWSSDQVVVSRLIQVNPDQPLRARWRVLAALALHWENWARSQSRAVVINTMRRDQAAFLRWLAQRGYHIQGSWAWITPESRPTASAIA